MGRRKLEMKRIEDKNSRSVTFTKRRSGLFKKARQLSVLCDVDIAVIVFSAGGKLYESCSGGRTNSVEHVLSRYRKSWLEAGERTIDGAGEDLREFFLQSKRFRTCKGLLQTVDRLVEENNTENLSVSDMTQLEQELDASLMQTRLRKTQLMMEHISTLHEKERKLCEEKQELRNQVVGSAKQKQNDVDEGGGGLNDLAINQTTSPPQLTTLPLFDA